MHWHLQEFPYLLLPWSDIAKLPRKWLHLLMCVCGCLCARESGQERQVCTTESGVGSGGAVR